MHPHERKSVTHGKQTHLGVAMTPEIRDNQGVQLARRGFLRLISALPAFAVFRSLPVQAAPVSEFTWEQWPPLDGPVTGACEVHGHRYVFTERSVWDMGPV